MERKREQNTERGGARERKEGERKRHDQQERVWSLPRSSSTPSSSPVELSGLYLESLRSSVKCGFYWHRNHLLPKQKNIASNLLTQHDKVLSELTRVCSGEDGRLGDIVERLLSNKPPPL